LAFFSPLFLDRSARGEQTRNGGDENANANADANANAKPRIESVIFLSPLGQLEDDACL